MPPGIAKVISTPPTKERAVRGELLDAAVPWISNVHIVVAVYCDPMSPRKLPITIAFYSIPLASRAMPPGKAKVILSPPPNERTVRGELLNAVVPQISNVHIVDAVYRDPFRLKKFAIARAGWIGDYVDPNSFLDVFLSESGNNTTGWAHPDYDDLIAKAAQHVDPEARFEAFQQAEKLLLTELPMLPIYWYTSVYLKKPEVQNWYPTLLDHHPYKYVRLIAPAAAP